MSNSLANTPQNDDSQALFYFDRDGSTSRQGPGFNGFATDTFTSCEISAREWVSETFNGNKSDPKFPSQPVRVLCPFLRRFTDGPDSFFVVNQFPACSLANRGAYDDLVFLDQGNDGPPFYRYRQFMQVHEDNTCEGFERDDFWGKCLTPGNRISFPFWDPTSFSPAYSPGVFGDSFSELQQYSPPPLQLHRLPAISLRDVEPSAISTGSCRASWDASVPVRCGADKTRYFFFFLLILFSSFPYTSFFFNSSLPSLTFAFLSRLPNYLRYLVAKLGARGNGARGIADTTTWPTPTFAYPSTHINSIFLPLSGGPDVRILCLIYWRRFDGVEPTASEIPVVTSMVCVCVSVWRERKRAGKREGNRKKTSCAAANKEKKTRTSFVFLPPPPNNKKNLQVITQSAGPIFAGEEKLSWASGATDVASQEERSASLANAYPSNTSSSTSFDRYVLFFF